MKDLERYSFIRKTGRYVNKCLDCELYEMIDGYYLVRKKSVKDSVEYSFKELHDNEVDEFCHLALSIDSKLEKAARTISKIFER
jgi:hypothetical protein